MDMSLTNKQLSKIKLPVLLPLIIAFFLIWLLFVGVAWLWFESLQQRSLQERINQFDDQLFQEQTSVMGALEERLTLLESLIVSNDMVPLESIFEQTVAGMKLSRLTWVDDNGELRFETATSLLPLDIAMGYGDSFNNDERGLNYKRGLILLPTGELILRAVQLLPDGFGALVADYPFVRSIGQLSRAHGVYTNLIAGTDSVDPQLAQAFPAMTFNQYAQPFSEATLTIYSSDALVNPSDFISVYQEMMANNDAGRFSYKTGIGLGEEYFDLALLPFFGVEGELIAQTLVVKNTTQDQEDTLWLQLVVTVAALLIAALLLMFFYFLLGRIERRIQSGELQILEERDRSESLRIESETLRIDAETHREQAELARDEAEKASLVKSEFLAKMSHELRTPLNAIIGLSEMMHEDAKEFGDEDYVEPLERVIRASKHLLSLINEILDISKIESGKMEIYPENADLDALVTEVIETAETLVKDKPIAFTLDKDTLGRAVVDPTRFKQVLFNLISNAIKFTDQGEVGVAATMHDGDVKISVTDTGPGISEEQLSTLFKEFVQLDSKSNRKHEGTGLGLAISRKFAQMMGGNITVTSELGKGSTFTFSIPLRLPKVSSTDVISADLQTLLLIDDDPTSAELIRRHIPEDVQVEVAENGVQALEIARNKRVDMITLDVEMPLLNGWDTLAALRADKALANIPVVIISVSDERQKAYEMGATDYLVKPIKQEDVERILHTASKESSNASSVLVVDDSEEIRMSARKLFERLGLTVFEAENGQVALQRLAQVRPDFVILDLMMPEMDGFELLQRMRSGEFKDLDVYIMTAMELTPEQKQWLEGRATAVLSKGGDSEGSFLSRMKSIVKEARG
ncbi:response regulator [Rhodanobacter aciditrophus]|uniref:histidine kinase n=1 Tax=Rhodanobacter aciditrophus TaxID=1623218 RepID=A0ABW4B2Q9_9GAMM